MVYRSSKITPKITATSFCFKQTFSNNPSSLSLQKVEEEESSEEEDDSSDEDDDSSDEESEDDEGLTDAQKKRELVLKRLEVRLILLCRGVWAPMTISRYRRRWPRGSYSRCHLARQ